MFFLSLQAFFNKDFLPGKRIQARIIHEGGIGGRSGCEDLNLFGRDLQLLIYEFFHLSHIIEATSRMRGNQVIGQELSF